MSCVLGISQHVPSKKLIKEVSSALKKKWKLVAVFLKVPKHQVEMWKDDDSKDSNECIRLVFEWWKNSQSRYKLATLLDILEDPEVNEQELANVIKFRVSIIQILSNKLFWLYQLGFHIISS